MSTVDRVSGDWYLKSLNGNVYIDARAGQGTVSVYGDLVVIGSQTNIGSIETLIADNVITLAANVTTGTPVLDAGIDVLRGEENTVGIRWIESIDRWQLTNDGLYYGNIMIRLEDDQYPRLGGDLFVNGFVIRSDDNQNIKLSPGAAAGIEIAEITGNVEPFPGTTIMYAKEPGNGQAGLYVTNSVSNNEELITKRKAVIYSLVL
jgi:hypothetical protein